MRRVLAVVLDTVDAGLALEWAADGRLPTLGRLLREGSLARLRTLGELYPESVWPSLTTGASVGRHGVYNWRVIRPGTYTLAWAPSGRDRPFWAELADAGRPAIVVDAPFTRPLGAEGITEVVGWGQRAAPLEASSPPDLLDAVRRRHGRYPRWVDAHYARGVRSARRLLTTLERMAAVRTRLVADLMRERPWSLCLAVYWETHAAGHEFHRHLDPGGWGYDARAATALGDGLLRSYQAADRGLGELVAAAGEDCDVVAISGMGLRRNATGEHALAELLRRMGHLVPARPPTTLRPLHALRGALPWSIRFRLHRRLSQEQRDRAMQAMWLQRTDWGRTRAFSQPEPGHGWIRLNVAGREPEGLVAPGAEARALEDEIAGELGRLTNADTGEPVVSGVLRRGDVGDGPRAGDLPDLTLRFPTGSLVRRVRHPELGVWDEQLRDVPYTEHSGEGFLVAAGPGVRAGSSTEGVAEDVPATLLALSGVDPPGTMDGAPLAPLLARTPA